MAETGPIGLATARAQDAEDPSKAELQRRMDEARHAITGTVAEIKNSVTHQYEVMKETIDWRHQFNKRPIACSIGALASGLTIGWAVTSIVRGNQSPAAQISFPAPPAEPAPRNVTTESRSSSQGSKPRQAKRSETGLLEQIAATPIYKEIRDEGASLGKDFISEVSKIGHEVLLPAITGKIRDWLSEQIESDDRAKRGSARKHDSPNRDSVH